MARASALLFVYGTLRPGGATTRGPDSKLIKTLKAHAELVGKAQLKGRLHWIDWYPGFVESRREEDVVTGDVYRLNDAAMLLPELDKYEDAAPKESAKHEYVRRRKLITMNNGQRAFAWVYVYNRPEQIGQRIPHGDFVRSVRGASRTRRRRATR